MEKIVRELKKVVPFKDSTAEGDIVLIAIENPKSVVYGLVTKIERDETKRDEWWRLTMHILSVPPQETTWTLREPQFTGKEIFTMGNEGRFIQAVDLGGAEPEKRRLGKSSSGKKSERKTALRVVK